MALLGECGPIQMTDFWKLAVDKTLLKHPIGVNNLLRRLQDKNLVIKQKLGKRVVLLNPDLKIESEGNIVINNKIFKLEGKKSEGIIPDHSKELELA